MTVDGMLAYSKLASGDFPDFDALALAIKAYKDSGVAPEGWVPKK